MADEPKGVGDALASLGTAITSPAKLAFAGYVILVYKGALCGVSLSNFICVAVAFLALQIVHDDFLRTVLNRAAEQYRYARIFGLIFGTAVIALLCFALGLFIGHKGF